MKRIFTAIIVAMSAIFCLSLCEKMGDKGFSLYYTLEGSELTIYHGAKGWKSEVRNTVYASGIYDSAKGTITIEDKVFNR